MVQRSSQDQGLIVQWGPLKVDVPRSLGYYGGIGVALAVGLIDPPLALFIGAIPAMKMLINSSAPKVLRFVGQVFDGASQPLGGDAEGTVRLDDAAAERATTTVRKAVPSSRPRSGSSGRAGRAAGLAR